MFDVLVLEDDLYLCNKNIMQCVLHSSSIVRVWRIEISVDLAALKNLIQTGNIDMNVNIDKRVQDFFNA